MISGSVSSYSRRLNDANRLREYAEVNQLAAAVAEVSADIEEEKQQKKKRKAIQTKEKAQKQAQKQKDEDAKKEQVLPALRQLMLPFELGQKDATIEAFGRLKRDELRDLLKYYYLDAKGLSGLKISELAQRVHSNFVDKLKTNPAPAASSECFSAYELRTQPQSHPRPRRRI
jgi:D-alanyl-D-alanine carboxypeptidase